MLVRGRRSRRRCSSPAWRAAACRSRSRTARAAPSSATPRSSRAARPLVALRFVDNRGAATEAYPHNPNGSPDGITGLTTRRRPRHDPDAAPRARVPHRADVVASATSGARTARGCGCSATRASGSAERGSAKKKGHDAQGLLHRRNHAGGRSDGLRASDRGADRRRIVGPGCYVGPWRPARRFRPARNARRQQHAGHLRRARLPGTGTVVEEDGHIGHGAVLHGCTSSATRWSA